jgi:hypothetical protein
MLNRSLGLVTCSLFLVCVVAKAQSPEMAPEKRALIRELLEVTGTKQVVGSFIETILRQQEKDMLKALSVATDNVDGLRPSDREEAKRLASDEAVRVRGG